MKKIILKSNISKILGTVALLGFFLSILIVSPVFPQTANAGWITSDIFGGGNYLTDNILGIDPRHDYYYDDYYYDDYYYDDYYYGGYYYDNCVGGGCGCGSNCYPVAPIYTPPNPALIVSCYANPANANVGDSLNWSAGVSGGNGPYSYSWSGTDGLVGNSSSISKVYTSAGYKNASVTVVSGSQSVTSNCSANINQAVVVNNLTVSCSSNTSNADTDEDVTWQASASGGTGSYSYSWSGTNGLSGSNRNLVWSYDNSGTKRATVTVTSNGQSASASCNMYVNEDDNYDNLSVSCYASPTNPQVNNQMNWYADVSGGDGDYTYSWRGSDGLSSSSRSPRMTYSTPGSKSATITVRSNGRSVSADCYTNVNQNSVLSFSQSYQPPLASAVYLSQIPSTGVYDNMKLVYFVGFLGLFSAWIAYIVIARKKEVEARN